MAKFLSVAALLGSKARSTIALGHAVGTHLKEIPKFAGAEEPAWRHFGQRSLATGAACLP